MKGTLMKKIDGSWIVLVPDDANECSSVIVSGRPYPLHPDNIKNVKDSEQNNEVEFSLEQIDEKEYAKVDWKCSMCGGVNNHKMSCKTPSLREEKLIVTNNLE